MKRPWVFALALISVLAGAAPASPKASKADQVAHGRLVFQQYCAACHGSGIGRPGTEVLQLRYQGAVPALLADRKDLNAEVVQAVTRNGIGWMPGFRKTEITDRELDALAAYLSRHPDRQ